MRKIVVCFFTLFVLLTGSSMAQADVAAAVLAEINRWRTGESLVPVVPNEILTAMAVEQAAYIASLPLIPSGGDIHLDVQNRNPRQRSQDPRFAYPPYGAAFRVLVTEIAAVGSLDSAFNFWRSSDLHRRSVTNPVYREIGIATLPVGDDDTLFIVVLGAQPNVLPAMLDRSGELLYLSNEYSEYADGAWIGTVTRYQLFDEHGRPLTSGWEDWEPYIELPETDSDTIYVLYSDGVTSALNVVSQHTDTPAVTPTTTPTSIPTFTPTPARGDSVFRTQVPTSTPSPTATATSTPAPTATVTQAPPRELVIIYDDRSILITTSADRVDVSGVSLVDASGTALTLNPWTRTMSSLDLTNFRSRMCLIAYPWDTSSPSVPDTCGRLLAVLTVAPDRAFWRSGTFTVQNNGETVGTCNAADGECRVSLPGS